jgi:hypothetical protein
MNVQTKRNADKKKWPVLQELDPALAMIQPDVQHSLIVNGIENNTFV